MVAREAAEFLTEAGLRVFFSERELPKMGNSDYSDAINNALDGAHHLLVVTSSVERVTSKWVKYEWQTFHNENLSNRKQGNILTLICGGISIADLPLILRQYEARPQADLSKIINYFRS